MIDGAVKPSGTPPAVTAHHWQTLTDIWRLAIPRFPAPRLPAEGRSRLSSLVSRLCRKKVSHSSQPSPLSHSGMSKLPLQRSHVPMQLVGAAVPTRLIGAMKGRFTSLGARQAGCGVDDERTRNVPCFQYEISSGSPSIPDLDRGWRRPLFLTVWGFLKRTGRPLPEGPSRSARSQTLEQHASAPATAGRVRAKPRCTEEPAACKDNDRTRIHKPAQTELLAREACLPDPCAGRLPATGGRPRGEHEQTQEVLKKQWLAKISSDSRFVFGRASAGALSRSPSGHDVIPLCGTASSPSCLLGASGPCACAPNSSSRTALRLRAFEQRVGRQPAEVRNPT
jgi:hypothetical protein